MQRGDPPVAAADGRGSRAGSVSRRGFLRTGAALALGGAGLTLAACGTKTSALTSTAASTSTAAPAVHKTIRLTGNFPHVPNATVAAEVLKAFTKANPHIEITPQKTPPPAQKLATLVEAGQAPDFFVTTNAFVSTLFQAKAVIDLSQYTKLNRSGPMMRDIPSSLLAAQRTGSGQQMAIPSKAATMGVYYNVDGFRAAHIPLPTAAWTYTDYRDALLRLTNATKKIWGGGGDPWRFSVENAVAWGSAWVPPSNPVTLNYNAQIVAGETFIQNLRYVDKSWMPGSIMNWSKSFPSGQMMTIRQNSYSLLAYGQAVNGAFHWSTAPVPSGPARQAVSVSPNGWMITTSSKNPDAAWEAVLFGHSPAFWNIVMPVQGTIPPQISLLPTWRKVMSAQAVLKGVDLTAWTDPIAKDTLTVQPVFKYDNGHAWHWWGNAVGSCLTGTPPKGDANVASTFKAAAVATDAYEKSLAAKAAKG